MKEVGYKDTTIHSKTGEVVKSVEFQKEMEDFNNQLEELIQNNVKHDKIKQKTASFRDSIEAINHLEKLRMLKAGVPTDNVLVVNWSNKGDNKPQSGDTPD